MVDKTPQDAMAGTLSTAEGIEFMVFDRASPPHVNSIPANNLFGPNMWQVAHGNHSHGLATTSVPGFLSTADKVKIDSLATNRLIPSGGTTGQFIQKTGTADYAIAWGDAPAGEGGGPQWAQQGVSTVLAAANPVMTLGAKGWETDTYRWKIGDGVTAWNSLPYQDEPRTPSSISNPGTSAQFGFRPGATQTIIFSTPPAGTVVIQAPTNAPPGNHEGLMYFRIVNNSGSTITISASAFALSGDYLLSTLLTGTTTEYTIWIQGGSWYIGGEQDIADGSISNVQLADMATNRIKGRYTAGTGDPEDLVPNQVRWMVDNAQPSIVNIGVNTTLTKAAHQGKQLVCTSPVSLTVDASTDIDQYYDLTISAEGGAVTIVATATVNAPSGLIIPQYGIGSLRRLTGTDIYSLDIFSHPKVVASNSISGTLAAGTNTLALSGDTASPGASKYYGTNAGSTRGFYDFPTGGAQTLSGLQDVLDALNPQEDQALIFSSGLWRAATIATAGGSGSFVDNISALTGIVTPSDKQCVYVRGYDTPDDGGDGMFIWVASATDHKMCTAAAVNAGGTLYDVNDLIRPNGGTKGTDDETILRVTAVTGGAVTALDVVYAGKYSVAPTLTGCATTTAAQGTGCTVNLTMASWTDYGLVFPQTAGGAGRWVRIFDGPANIKFWGAKGDGTTDDALAVNRAVWSGAELFVPSGNYRLISAIWWHGARQFTMKGAIPYGPGESKFVDSRAAGTEEPLFHKFGRWMKADGTYSFETGYEVGGTNLGGIGPGVVIENIGFRSEASIYGACFELTLSNDNWFLNCFFQAKFRGLTFGQSCFHNNIIGCRFISSFMASFPWSGTTGAESNKVIAKRAWAIRTGGHSFIHGIDVVGWGGGVNLAGPGSTFTGARIEVNNYGIICSGVDYLMQGAGAGVLSSTTLSGLRMEANTVGILVDSLTACSLSGLSIQGSAADVPSSRPASENGIVFAGMAASSDLSAISVGGTFSHGGIVNNTRESFSRFISSSGGTEVSYARMNGVFGQTGSNVPIFHLINHRNERSTITTFSDLMLPSLTGLNIRDNVKSRNFGDVVTPTEAATSTAILFPTVSSTNTFAFNTLTPTADATTALAAGTYYYATTVIGKTGETGINYSDATLHAHKTVVVAAQQKVVLNFFGGTVPRLKRRVYRTRNNAEIGNFEGYWEFDSGPGFTDDGKTAFTARGMPPMTNDITALVEPDTNYQIVCTPSWSTTTWVTAKTTLGFTINFGTAVPAGGTCGWLLYRP